MCSKQASVVVEMLKSTQPQEVVLPLTDFSLEIKKSELEEGFHLDIKVSILSKHSHTLEQDIVPLFGHLSGYKRGFNLWKGSGVIATATFMLSHLDRLTQRDFTVDSNPFISGQKLNRDNYTHSSKSRMKSFLKVILQQISSYGLFYESILKKGDVEGNFYVIESEACVGFFWM